MNVGSQYYRSIALNPDGWRVDIIDQTRLPHEFYLKTLQTLDDAVIAIQQMWVRGAPLIGATAAYGLCLALRRDTSDRHLESARQALLGTRPTAVNLRWALDDMTSRLQAIPNHQRVEIAYQRAAEICDEDVATNAAMGDHGERIIRRLWEQKGRPDRLNILTHCNAGWLATVDWGTALAPIYKAHAAGIPIHVWVDETRPRNQGASLTTWELQAQGIPHHLIVDNAGGQLMQQGQVDLCIVGTDRTTANGDVCNKIGTYLKALAAFDNKIPFYVALPGTTIDWTIFDGIREIPIEQRNPNEVTHLTGKTPEGELQQIQITPDGCLAANPAFDITPARLITGLITERGICDASAAGLHSLFPEQ